jgi:hypothetical protein
MSRQQTFANVGWARAFNVLAPTFDDSTLQVDLDTLVSVLEALPSYAEFELNFITTGDEHQTVRLMARDIPGAGRRFTSLTTGTEWFNIGRIIQAREPQFVVVHKPGEDRQQIFVSL